MWGGLKEKRRYRRVKISTYQWKDHFFLICFKASKRKHIMESLFAYVIFFHIKIQLLCKKPLKESTNTQTVSILNVYLPNIIIVPWGFDSNLFLSFHTYLRKKTNLVSSSHSSLRTRATVLKDPAALPPPSKPPNNTELSSRELSVVVLFFFPSSPHDRAAAVPLLVCAGCVGGPPVSYTNASSISPRWRGALAKHGILPRRVDVSSLQRDAAEQQILRIMTPDSRQRLLSSAFKKMVKALKCGWYDFWACKVMFT